MANDADKLRDIFAGAGGRHFHQVIEEIALAFMEKLDRMEAANLIDARIAELTRAKGELHMWGVNRDIEDYVIDGIDERIRELLILRDMGGGADANPDVTEGENR